jgi:Na+-transporting NADH:ubiquinone oxidoreductase subunit NqrE
MENLDSIGSSFDFHRQHDLCLLFGHVFVFGGISKKVSTAFGLGLAVIFVLGVTVPINWLIQNYVLNARRVGMAGNRVCKTVDLNFLFTVYCLHFGYRSHVVQLDRNGCREIFTSTVWLRWVFFCL